MNLFLHHSTEVRFASFLSGIFTTVAVMNPPEKKLENRTSVHSVADQEEILKVYMEHTILLLQGVELHFFSFLCPPS